MKLNNKIVKNDNKIFILIYKNKFNSKNNKKNVENNNKPEDNYKNSKRLEEIIKCLGKEPKWKWLNKKRKKELRPKMIRVLIKI